MSPLALSLRFLQTQPDARLLALAQAGHERAFEALVQRYRKPLLSYCRRLVAGDALAEDVLQQALLQAWVALRREGTEVREARPWLYRIVHNTAISNLRSARRDTTVTGGLPTVVGADMEVERRLAARDALAGLASLPELQRRVMLSTALEGRSYEEVAAALGLSDGAVRGLLYRARAALRAAAAVIVPSPLVQWAARQGLAPETASVGGLLLKGGAVAVTAGALASAAGIGSNAALSPAHHRPVTVRLQRAPAPRSVSPASSLARGGGSGGLVIAPGVGVGAASATATQLASGGRDHGRGRSVGVPVTPAPAGPSCGSSNGGPSVSSGPGGGSSSGGGTSGPSGGSDGGSSGSSSGGPAGTSTTTSSSGSGGSDGGSSTSGTSGSSDSSGMSGSDGGGSDGGTTTTATVSSSSGDGSGH